MCVCQKPSHLHISEACDWHGDHSVASDGEWWQVIAGCWFSDKLAEGESPLLALSGSAGSALLEFLRWRKYMEGGSSGVGRVMDIVRRYSRQCWFSTEALLEVHTVLTYTYTYLIKGLLFCFNGRIWVMFHFLHAGNIY